MKENKRPSRVSKLYKPLITIFVALATTVLGLFSALQLTNASRNNNQPQSTVEKYLQSAPAPASVVSGLPPKEPGLSPKWIYHLGATDPQTLVPAAINTTQVPGAVEFVTQYIAGLREYDLLTDSTLETYWHAYTEVAINNISPTLQEKVDEARLLAANFTDRAEVRKNYDTLNGFGVVDTKTPLNIIQPEAIYDVYSKGSSTPVAGADANGDLKLDTTQQEFEYLVATVDLNVLKDKKSLAFVIKDKTHVDAAGNPDANEHNYTLVISNENNEINDFLLGQGMFAGHQTLQDLIDARVIFVRDDMDSDKARAAAYVDGVQTVTEHTAIFENLRIQLNQGTNVNELQFFIKPESDNVDKDHSIEFKISDEPALKDSIGAVSAYGILDNNYSPTYTKNIGYGKTDFNPNSGFLPYYTEFSNPLDLTQNSENLIFADATKSITDFPIHARYGNWNNGAGTQNGLRLYMGDNTIIEQQVKFNGMSTDAFDGGDNNLTIEFKNGTPKVTPNKFSIKADKIGDKDITAGALEIPTRVLGTDPSKFLEVTIKLPKGLIQIAPNGSIATEEAPYKIKNMYDRIFFETPLTVPNPPTIIPKTIALETKTEVTDKDLELIGDIYRNWSGVEKPVSGVSNAVNPAYIINDGQTGAYVRVGSNVNSQTGQSYIPGVASGNGFATFGTEASLYGSNDFTIQFPLVVETENGGASTLGTQNGVILVDSANIINQYKDMLSVSNNPVDVTLSQSIVRDTDVEDDTWQPIYFDADGKHFVGNDDSKIVTLPATGQMITTLFIDYTNTLFRWANEKLGIPQSEIGRDNNEYKLDDPSGSIGFVQARIIDRSGDDGIRLKAYAGALSKYWTNSQGMTEDEQDIITELMAQYAPFKDAGIDIPFIMDKGRPDAATGVINTSDPAYLKSRQIIYYVLQPYLVSCLTNIMTLEYDAFQSKQNVALGKYVHSYMQSQDPNSIGIPDDLIVRVNPTIPEIADLDLLALGKYGTIATKSGLEELSSLLNFIQAAGLQFKYLSPTEIETFNDFMATRDFADDKIYTDPANQAILESFLLLLSKILKEIVGDQPGVLTMAQIVQKVSNHEYDLTTNPNAPTDDIRKTIRAAITRITSDEVYGTLSFMGTSQDVTYLESLIMGKNIYEVFDKYIQTNLELTPQQKATLEDFRDKSTFNISEQSRLAINLGYYNIPYFVRQLTQADSVQDMALEMLHSNLSEDIRITIDTDNQLIQFITDSDSLTKYAFMGIGIGTFAIGTAIFGLSFRKSIRFSSKKSAITERLIFMSIAIIGAILAAISFIPGIM